MELNIIIINALAHVLYDYKQGRPGTINQSCIRLSSIPHDLCLYIYVNICQSNDDFMRQS